jgi:rare lipoprotein A
MNGPLIGVLLMTAPLCGLCAQEAAAVAPLERAENQAAGGTEGTASWYGGKFQGRRTASGEMFDTRAFTAAHRSLPFGTLVKVTNLDNGKSTVVRITDRGPFVGDRLIDVSQAAAIELDMMKTGVARVRVEVVSRPDSKTGVYYRIQVASFRDPGKARQMKSLLAAKGFSVFLETVSAGYTRVHVDNVSAGDLEAVRGVLRGLGLHDQLVKKID